MALIKCKECGREISDAAPACPSCGAPRTAPAAPVARVTRTGGRWEAIGFLLIIAGIVIGLATDARVGWMLGIAGLVVFLIGRFK